jgi:hypothetical protein
MLNHAIFRTLFQSALLAIVFATPAKATLLVDFSPDTTGASLDTAGYLNNYGVQIMGDRFSLATDVVLTGSSIYSRNTWGSVGDSARLMIFGDLSGTPTATPLIDLVTTLDAVDTQLTSSIGELTRKHATISDTFLAAGTYWFSMPGNGVELGQASGNYDNNGLRFGASGTNLTNICNNCGDAFFTLEGTTNIPEPATFTLVAAGLLAGWGVKKRRVNAQAERW